MSLSIFDAARETPDRVAIIDGDRPYTYRELAALADRAPRTNVVVGAATLDAIVHALSLLARKERIVFVHPRWVEAERERILEGAARVIAEPRSEGAAVFFTSGTTGTPKPVVHTADLIERICRLFLDRIGIAGDERWWLALPIAHVAGFAVVMRALISRRTIILGARGLEQATIASLVPTMLHRLLERDDALAAPHLRLILLGGAPATPALLERAASRGLKVTTTYGLTETFGGVVLDGRPLEGVGLRLRETIEVNTGGGWIDTGDFGELDADGELRVLSRRTDRIITGGENVDPIEVEGALEECGEIQRAAVFGAPDETWGEVVCAAIVPRRGRTIDRGVLDTHLAKTLAPFKRPRRWLTLAELPETPGGKVDRAALKLWVDTEG
jgi:O-succinylbenzoic acid--CoA ligase